MNLLNVSPLCAVKAVAAASVAMLAFSTVAQVNDKGNTRQERAWCMANANGAARADCLKQANAAQPIRRRENLDTNSTDYAGNSVERCKVFEGADRVACQARVMGYGTASGSVEGGGVLKQIETVVLPASPAAVVIEPSAAGRIVVVPGERRKE